MASRRSHALSRVDSLAKYTDSQRAVSTVASCDIYDFTNGRISGIASYNVALDSE